MIVAIVQARMGSSRLPGKVLKHVSGRPILGYQIERIRRSTRVDHLVIATTALPADDAIEAFCERESVTVIRGPEIDVLGRFALAARITGATTVVRLTADCPLIDPAVIDLAIESFGVANCDYLSNMHPPTWPYGMAVEVMTRQVLDEAVAEAIDPDEREHVTPFVYRRPERYRLRSITRQPDLSAQRWTVDTPEDFELVSRIIGMLYPSRPEFMIDDVLTLLDSHPDWIELNRHVEQKTVASLIKNTR
jgi:spore coat polysaccharide biosynthesis protein SpsF